MIFICIPVFERLQLTINCINSIKRQTYTGYTVVVCEHSPTDTTYNELKKLFPEIVLLRGDDKMWWTAATNKCVEYAIAHGTSEDYVFTLNNDVELAKDCLHKLIISAKEYPNSIIGCVNLLYDERNRIEPSAQKVHFCFGMEFYIKLNRWRDRISDYRGIIEATALAGKGVLIPIKTFKSIGLFNAEKLPHYHADTEFTIRASKAGWQILINYSAQLYSHYKETGKTSRNNSGSIKDFYRSFFSLKSTRHLRSLQNREKLLHGNLYPIYLSYRLFCILGGFIKKKLTPP